MNPKRIIHEEHEGTRRKANAFFFVFLRVPSWIVLFLALLLEGCASTPSPDSRFTVGPLLYSHALESDGGQWQSELEKRGKITIDHGAMDIDVPGGATVWLNQPLAGPVMIQYKATAISEGGPNDRVSDLNCFWMARDSRDPTDLFAVHRTGKFADYNQLLTYYASIGGNSNSTTRFRRYIGAATTRPIRPQDDLRDQPHLLMPNQKQTITLIAAGSLIQFYRDNQLLFELNDDHPYTSGYFALRTVDSHLRIEDLKIYQLQLK